MDQTPVTRKREILTALAVLLLIVVIVGVVTVTTKKSTDTAISSENTTTSPGTASNTSPSANASTYKDGTYSATGVYTSPGGAENISITVTLKDNVITATNATPGAERTESKEYQGKFISGYQQQVIGKAIDSVNLSRVSGSSLTPQGFNDAIKQIENQAKV